LGSHPSNRKHNENDAKETYQIINQSYTKYLTMVVENLSFWYGFLETRTFTNFASTFTPFVQLIRLLKKWSCEVVQ